MANIKHDATMDAQMRTLYATIDLIKNARAAMQRVDELIGVSLHGPSAPLQELINREQAEADALIDEIRDKLLSL